MTKHKVAYVDEQATERRNFQRRLGEEFDVIAFSPQADVMDLVHELVKSGAEAIITDYKLSEYREVEGLHINYDGTRLVEEVLKIRKGYPCFVLTSYDNDAIKETSDVNIVYPKDLLTTDAKIGSTTFQEKVRVQIEHYNASIKSKQKEYSRLKKKKRLTEKEEEQMIELDTFFEELAGPQTALPKKAKKKVELGQLTKLIKNTDELIKELRKKQK